MHKPFLVPAARIMAGTGHTQCPSAVEGCVGKTVKILPKDKPIKIPISLETPNGQTPSASALHLQSLWKLLSVLNSPPLFLCCRKCLYGAGD